MCHYSDNFTRVASHLLLFTFSESSHLSPDWHCNMIQRNTSFMLHALKHQHSLNVVRHLLMLSSLLSSFQWYCWGALVSAQMPRSCVRLRCRRRHCLAKDCVSSSCVTLAAALFDLSLAHNIPEPKIGDDVLGYRCMAAQRNHAERKVQVWKKSLSTDTP